MTRRAVCTECGQADQTEKVSTLYLMATELKWDRTKGRPAGAPAASPAADGPLSLPAKLPAKLTALTPVFAELPPAELQALGRRLAPPSSKKEVPIRLIHPDWVVAALSMIAPVFLYGVITTQPGSLPVTLAALAAFYLFYFWRRKALLARFAVQQAKERGTGERVQRAVQRWMSLYYCARDDCVFDPDRKVSAPLDQMAGLLMSDVMTGTAPGD